MSSRTLSSQLEGRPLADLTQQVARESAIQVAGGAFGDVYKCRRYTSGSSSLVAVKCLRYFVSEDPEENQRKLESNNKVGSVFDLPTHALTSGGRYSAENSVF
ncbi:hypothetical protein JVT61DRAFT_10767 [Boletus reticuloceps]|uniref:Protein kinase domain-containing protein n=1 Tax=Boletus reticuloceps TaxID=495285 RepID=A0A8I3A5H9_9AGAM|nr:hypothetical protein JVT61DRAFT_10767 [Boletus reticuloceps]